MAMCLMVTVFEWSFLVVQLVGVAVEVVVVEIHSEVVMDMGRNFAPKEATSFWCQDSLQQGPGRM